MTERRNPKLFQVLVCQMGQDSKGNVVLGKALRVLPRGRCSEASPQSAASCPPGPQDIVFILLTRGL